jgi:membrane-bound lytic murein transglycosylase D
MFDPPWNRRASPTAMLLVVALGAPGCLATLRGPDTEPVAVAAVEPAVPAEERTDLLALYGELDWSRREYEEGIDLIAGGDEVFGERKIATATARIRAGAVSCAEAPDCDSTRFVDAFERLLVEQGIALKTQASRVVGLEAELEQLETEVDELEREPGTSSFVASMPEIARTESLLRGTDLTEIINLNGPVNAALDDWLTWMRPMLMTSYENYLFLREEVAPIYEEAGLPEALLFAMMATETGAKVHSYSRAGAAGPLQFMRRTGQVYGLRVEDGFDMRLDPGASTRAAVEYLNDRFAALNDSLEMALAAYNGGESRVERLNRTHRGAGFWDSRIYYSLPRETREYVPRILAAAWLFLHADQYNLEFPSRDAETVSLDLKDEIALGELTICLGQVGSPNGWFRTLRNLNPRLSPGERIPAGDPIRVPQALVEVYERNCLEGETIALARQLHEANYPPEPQTIEYTVQRNDTLGRIASRHRCVSLQELAAINGVRPPRYMIRVGQEIKIPSCN